MSTEYICEVSGRRYKTARGARESAKRERLRSYQRNYVRLNASTAQEFLNLMVEKSKEFYGWDMKLEYKKSSLLFWKNHKLEDKALSIEAEMWLSTNEEKGSRKNISHLISRHFERVDTSLTWEEVKHFSIPGAYKTIKFVLTLGDFPKLLESYKKFSEQQSEYITFLDKRSKASTDGTKFVASREDYKSMVEERIKIEKSLQKYNREIDKMFEYYKDGYMRLWECSNGKAPEIDPELSKTFG
jgi:hypothetical protein